MEIHKSLLKKGNLLKVLTPLDLIYCPKGMYEITSVTAEKVYFKFAKDPTRLRHSIPISYMIENYFKFQIDENKFIIQEDR